LNLGISKKFISLGVLALTLAGVAGWVIVSRNAAPIGANPNNPRQISLGREIYVSACAACHGAQLEGEPNWRTRKPSGRLPAPPHDETGHTWHHSDEVLFNITKHGVDSVVPGTYEGDMPAFDGQLSDEEIWAVLAYIKASWPENIRQRQNALNNRGTD